MRLLRVLKLVLFLGLAGLAALLLYGYARNHPEDLPWTELDLAEPVGVFTGRKLAAGRHRIHGAARALDRYAMRL